MATRRDGINHILSPPGKACFIANTRDEGCNRTAILPATGCRRYLCSHCHFRAQFGPVDLAVSFISLAIASAIKADAAMF
jgi:hypothetical protein